MIYEKYNILNTSFDNIYCEELNWCTTRFGVNINELRNNISQRGRFVSDFREYSSLKFNYISKNHSG